MVMAVLPGLEMVCDICFTVPVCTVPKFRLEGLDTRAPSATPAPDSGTDAVLVYVRDRLWRVTTIERLALTVPPEVGVKLTLHDALLPGANVSGRVSPLSLNVLLEVVAWLMVTLENPELVKVMG